MKTKSCSKCKAKKPHSDFYKNKARHDGLCNYCKECEKKKPVNLEQARKRHEKWRKSEKGQQYFSEYYQANKSDYYERNKKWCEDNQDRYREFWRKSKKTAKGKKQHTAQQAKRRATKRNATLNGFDSEMKEIYMKCPSGHHVDHIVPLLNPIVCGLHVPWNLQYLTAEENFKKNNNFEGLHG